MAYPIILVDSTNGAASDTACSGAGPTTALTGTAGATDGAGTTVTLDSGTDLTNVATDGSHCLYFADTTSGHRRFTKITGKAGSGGATPTVTVNEALAISLSGKSWAIGGVRATATGAVSLLLLNNAGGNGDAMPGWAVEMQSGHTESTVGIGLTRPGGDATAGLISLRGKAGAATRPVWTCTNNTSAIALASSTFTGWSITGFKIQNSAGSKGSAYVFSMGNYPFVIADMVLGDPTNKVQGVSTRLGGNNCAIQLVNCLIDSTNSGLFTDTNYTNVTLVNCWVKNCAAGISFGDPDIRFGVLTLIGCLFTGITGYAVSVTCPRVLVLNCTFDNNTGDGLALSGDAQLQCVVYNNNFTRNGGYGINADAGFQQAWLEASNNFGTGALANTSGAIHNVTQNASDVNVDPGYVNSGSNNWGVGTAVAALGQPTGNIGANQSATLSSVDIGASQRAAPAAGPVGSLTGARSIGTY